MFLYGYFFYGLGLTMLDIKNVPGKAGRLSGGTRVD